MSFLEIAVVILAISAIALVIQTGALRSDVQHVLGILTSLDAELFHIAQEQNPHWGTCGQCGRRSIVSQVVPRDAAPADSPDVFFCRPCWWLSDTMMLSPEDRPFRDRVTERDATAAAIGPGSA